MKLIIIRHGDPDYEHDTLTAQGRIEAALAADRISKLNVTDFYVSPLGRAQDTARYTLDKMHRTAETCPWLREFHAPIRDIRTGEERIPWDWLPADWTVVPEFYGKDTWYQTEIMQTHHVYDEAKRVYDGLDKILASHGYVREGNFYRAVSPNMDTLVFFCHFGVECVMLGHLLGISPMVLWHGFCAAPTAITVLTTEEWREGIAAFRMNTFADTGHLYIAGETPSFSARFCEMYSNMEERHD